jgi:hypothetical protein
MNFLAGIFAKIQWYLAIATAAALLGGYLGYHYEAAEYGAYKAAQAALAQQEADAARAVAAHDREVKDEIDAKDAVDLAGYAGYVDQLLRNQSHPRAVPAPAAGAQVACGDAHGPAVAGANPVVSGQAAGTDAADHVVLDALIQLQEWRAYARETGQVQ